MDSKLDKIKNLFENYPKTSLAVSGLVVLNSYHFFKRLHKQRQAQQIKQKWQKKSDEFVKKNDQSIENLVQKLVINIPEPVQKQILEAKLEQIKDMLEWQLITSEQLLNFYTLRALTMGKEYNLITVHNYEQALQQARYCDNLRKSNPEQCTQELFGLVISVKDSLDIKDLPSSVGLQNRVNDILKEDGLCIKILKKAGAIPFVKTNVPQLLFTIESQNLVFGNAMNPYHKSRAAGGSSGGEGGLVAMRCSPAGIGSDQGGSNRVPGAWCGILAFKPTTTRIPIKGHTIFHERLNGQHPVKPTLGPMTKYVEDCALIMRAQMNQKYYDELKINEINPYFNLRPWNKEQFETKRKLKIGYFDHFSFMRPCVTSQRAVKEALNALAYEGHELVQVQIPNVLEMGGLILKSLIPDRASPFQEILKGEQTVLSYDKLFDVLNMPKLKRKALVFLLKLLGQKQKAVLLEYLREYNIDEYKLILGQIEQYREEFMEFWSQQGLDAIVCPAYPLPALKHGSSQQIMVGGVFYKIFNLLDLPSGVLPITAVKEKEQFYDIKGSKNPELIAIQKEMENSKGLPIGVQVVCAPNCDELCLNVMKQIEEKVKFHQNFSPLK